MEEYLYLVKRLEGLQEAVRNLLGDAELKNIIQLYEEKMTARILTTRDY
ncbi:MAG: hypothetical protein ACI8Q2_000363 [Candidatus Omnitrophota bacterium]|jgi:hypothetical protein